MRQIINWAALLASLMSIAACGQTRGAASPQEVVKTLYAVSQNVITCRDGEGIKKILSKSSQLKYADWCAPKHYGGTFDPRFSDAPPEWRSRKIDNLKISEGNLTSVTREIFKPGCIIISATYQEATTKSNGRSDICLLNEDGMWVIDQIIYESRKRPFGINSDFNPQLVNQFFSD